MLSVKRLQVLLKELEYREIRQAAGPRHRYRWRNGFWLADGEGAPQRAFRQARTKKSRPSAQRCSTNFRQRTLIKCWRRLSAGMAWVKTRDSGRLECPHVFWWAAPLMFTNPTPKDSRKVYQRATRGLVTDAEVLQEMLHRFRSHPAARPHRLVNRSTLLEAWLTRYFRLTGLRWSVPKKSCWGIRGCPHAMLCILR